MRKITQQAIAAFMAAQSFSKDNTSVEVLPNVTVLRLHGHAIAYRYNDPEKTVSVSFCGWHSNTTKERLNGVTMALGLGNMFHTVKGQLMANGAPIDSYAIYDLNYQDWLDDTGRLTPAAG